MNRMHAQLPYIVAVQTTNQNFPIYAGTPTVVNFNSVTHGDSSIFTDSTDTFTAPVKGLYLVTAYVHDRGEASVQATYRYLDIIKDSGAGFTNIVMRHSRNLATSALDNVFGISDLLELNKGDALRLRMAQNSDEQLSLASAKFCMAMIPVKV